MEGQNYFRNDIKTLFCFSTVLALTLIPQKHLWLNGWCLRIMKRAGPRGGGVHCLLQHTLLSYLWHRANLLGLRCAQTGACPGHVCWMMNEEWGIFQGKKRVQLFELRVQLTALPRNTVFYLKGKLTNYGYLDLGIWPTSSWKWTCSFKEDKWQYLQVSEKKNTIQGEN